MEKHDKQFFTGLSGALAFVAMLCAAFKGAGKTSTDEKSQPEPTPAVSMVDADKVNLAYVRERQLRAAVNRECARLIKAGEINTAEQEVAYMEPRMVQARTEAFALIAEVENAALGPDDKGASKWTPERATQFRDELADVEEGKR